MAARLARPIERAGERPVAALGDEAPRQPEGSSGDRQVDPERGTPADRVDEEAAERRPERGGDGGSGGPGADRAAAHGLREARRDDGEALRHQERRADPLNRARRDQEADARRHGTGERGGREDDDADDEDEPAAETVAETAADQDEAAEHQRIGVDHPLQRRELGTERTLHRRQRNRDDGAVDEGERRGEDRGGKDERLVDRSSLGTRLGRGGAAGSGRRSRSVVRRHDPCTLSIARREPRQARPVWPPPAAYSDDRSSPRIVGSSSDTVG